MSMSSGALKRIKAQAVKAFRILGAIMNFAKAEEVSATAVNDALPQEYRRRTMGPEFALAIRRARQNSKKLIG